MLLKFNFARCTDFNLPCFRSVCIDPMLYTRRHRLWWWWWWCFGKNKIMWRLCSKLLYVDARHRRCRRKFNFAQNVTHEVEIPKYHSQSSFTHPVFSSYWRQHKELVVLCTFYAHSKRCLCCSDCVIFISFIIFFLRFCGSEGKLCNDVTQFTFTTSSAHRGAILHWNEVAAGAWMPVRWLWGLEILNKKKR